MALNTNAKAGDESRRNGDYIGFPTSETNDKRLSGVSVAKGVPATLNADNELAAAAIDGAGGGDNIIGVVYEYDVYGGNQGSGNEELVDADSDATVKTRGAVYADLSEIAASPSVGDSLGPNGEIVVVNDTQTTGLYEVLVR